LILLTKAASAARSFLFSPEGTNLVLDDTAADFDKVT
jgi:hypothetical protein